MQRVTIIRLWFQIAPTAFTLLIALAACGSNTTLPSIVAPTEIIAEPGPSQASLVWPEVFDASYYLVFYDTAANVSRNDPYVMAHDTKIIIRNLKNETEYFFAVASVSLSGVVGTLSAEVATIPLPAIPSTPTGLIAEAGQGSIILSWNEVSDATTYTIYFNTLGGVKKTDSSVEIAEKVGTYTHGSLADETTYFYRIAASNAGGTSPLSIEVSSTTLPPALVSYTSVTP